LGICNPQNNSINMAADAVSNINNSENYSTPVATVVHQLSDGLYRYREEGGRRRNEGARGSLWILIHQRHEEHGANCLSTDPQHLSLVGACKHGLSCRDWDGAWLSCGRMMPVVKVREGVVRKNYMIIDVNQKTCSEYK
jgi:hypothetical protein